MKIMLIFLGLVSLPTYAEWSTHIEQGGGWTVFVAYGEGANGTELGIGCHERTAGEGQRSLMMLWDLKHLRQPGPVRSFVDVYSTFPVDERPARTDWFVVSQTQVSLLLDTVRPYTVAMFMMLPIHNDLTLEIPGFASDSFSLTAARTAIRRVYEHCGFESILE